jgi:hypothetical protein
MRLHGEGAVAVDQRALAQKGRGGHDLRPSGLRVTWSWCQELSAIRLAAPVVFGAADGPAARELLDLAAQRLGDDLVAEADADQGHARGMDARIRSSSGGIQGWSS